MLVLKRAFEIILAGEPKICSGIQFAFYLVPISGPNGTGFAEPWESRDAFRLSGILAGELYDGWTRLFAELFCAVCVCEK